MIRYLCIFSMLTVGAIAGSDGLFDENYKEQGDGRITYELVVGDHLRTWLSEEIAAPCMEAIGEKIDVEFFDQGLRITLPKSSRGDAGRWLLSEGIPKMRKKLKFKDAVGIASQIQRWFKGNQVSAGNLFCNGEVRAFDPSLPADAEDRITRLITRVGTYGVAKIIRHGKELNDLSRSVKWVSPLKFINIATQTPELRACMRDILGSSFKWKSFVGGFGPSIRNEKNSGELGRELQSFAAYVGADYNALSAAAEREDWKAFVTIITNR